MKIKNKILKINMLLLSIIAFLLLCGCSTTYGRVNALKNERCLIEFNAALTLINRVNEITLKGDVNKISYYAGNRTLNFSCRISTIDNNYRYEEYKGEASITYDFEAGHHYKIDYKLIKENNKNYAQLSVRDLGTKTSSFNNGVYSGAHFSVEPHIGSGGLSYVNVGLGLGLKTLFDFGTMLEFSLIAGADIGFGEGGKTYYKDGRVESEFPISTVLGAQAGVFGKIYPPRTNFNIGGGFGYRVESGIPSIFDSFYSPFWRAEISYNAFGLFYEHYFNPAHTDSNSSGDPNIFKNWGVGFFARL